MKALSKSELLKQMKRFNADKDRGISIPLFCDLAGMSVEHFRDVFINDKHPLTETVQRRVNKAYIHWKMGIVKVMKRNDNTRYVDYRREAKPPIMPNMGLKLTSEGIKLRVGMVNRHDYSETDLNEALRG
jgi:hypothetical protein